MIIIWLITYSEFLDYSQVQYDTVVVFNHNNNVLRCHQDAQFWCCSGLHVPYLVTWELHFGRNTSTSCDHKLISLSYWGDGKLIGLQYLITSYVPVYNLQIINQSVFLIKWPSPCQNSTHAAGNFPHICLLSRMLPPTFVLTVLHRELNGELNSQFFPLILFVGLFIMCIVLDLSII